MNKSSQKVARIITLSFLSVVYFPAMGRVATLQDNRQSLDANAHVKRGLILSGHPLAHLTKLEESEREGMPKFSSLSKEAQLRSAVHEFQIAIQRSDELNGYSASQVHAFLGRALRLLGTELQRQTEQSPVKSQVIGAESQRTFEESVQQYRLAIKNDSGSLKYTFAQDLVQTIVSSGDLNRALMVINKFERERIMPSGSSDHGLLRQKAEIYSILGRDEDAGLAYEEWIRRGNVYMYLNPGDAFYEKLRNLKRITGHPNNLPSEITSGGVRR